MKLSFRNGSCGRCKRNATDCAKNFPGENRLFEESAVSHPTHPQARFARFDEPFADLCANSKSLTALILYCWWAKNWRIGTVARAVVACFCFAILLSGGAPAYAQLQTETIAGSISPNLPPANIGPVGNSPVNPIGAPLYLPLSVAVDPQGNVYFADTHNFAVRMVSCGSLITYTTFSVASGLEPTAVAADTFGNLFYGDIDGNIYRDTQYEVILSTLPPPTGGYIGDVANPLTDQNNNPINVGGTVLAMTTDSTGNLYVLSGTTNRNGGYMNFTVNKIGPGPRGVPVTMLTNQIVPVGTFDNQPQAEGLVVDAAGNLFTYAAGKGYNEILEISPTGTVAPFDGVTITGLQDVGYAGLALKANSASQAASGQPGIFYLLYQPGEIYQYIPSTGNGVGFSHYAGNPTVAGYNELNGPALEVELYEPNGLAIDTLGDLFIADTGNNLIRQVVNLGFISPSCGLGSAQSTDIIPSYGRSLENPTLDKLYMAVNKGNYTIGGPYADIVVFNTSNDTVAANVPIAGGPQWMAVDSTNNFVYTANSNATVSVVDSTTDTQIANITTFSRGLTSIAVDPASNLIYAVGNEDTNISVLQGPVRGTSGVTPPSLLTTIGNTSNIFGSFVSLGSVAVDTQKHKAYAIVDSGAASEGSQNYVLAIIDGTQTPPALTSSVTYISNAASTDIAPDAIGVDTTSGLVVIADAVDQYANVYVPSTGSFQEYYLGFYANHVAVDSVHEEAYLSDGYGNITVIDLAGGSQTKINSVNVSSNSADCGNAASAIVPASGTGQAFYTTCTPASGSALSIWDSSQNKVLSTLSLENGGNLFYPSTLLSFNPRRSEIFLSESTSASGSPVLNVLDGPTPGARPSLSFASTSNIATSGTVLNLGTAGVGTVGPDVQLVLTNTGSVTLNFAQPMPVINDSQDPGSVAITANSCSSSLAPQASCTIHLSFEPTKNESFEGGLAFLDNAGDTPQLVGIQATGQSPKVNLNILPATLPNGQVGVPYPSQMITVSNVPTGATLSVLEQSSGTLPLGLFGNFYYQPYTLSGTPTQAGTYTFTLYAIDTNQDTGSQTYTIVIAPGAPETVPNVVGLSLTAAGTAITNADLTTGSITMQSSSTVPTGNVISQNPAAGTTASAESQVSLVVSSGPAQATVPAVVGLTQAAASTAITGAGLTVGSVITQSSSTVTAGNVISESPTAGTSVATGSLVSLVVSSGPAQVTVPAVVGLTQAAASTAITGAGLTVGSVTTQSSTTVTAGDVISETPGAGTSVPVGSSVSLLVSSGPPAPANLSTSVSPTASGFAYSRVQKGYVGTVTITNTSGTTLTGPFAVLFTGLPSGVTLAGASGTYNGSPFLNLTQTTLAPGQSITLNVTLLGPAGITLKFDTILYSGTL